MLWLYLLGTVTVLIILLRRVLRKQTPLNDELYSKTVAIDHVHSSAAWIRSDGKIGSMNTALAASLKVKSADALDRDWYSLFPESEQERMKEAYAQMLLLGIANLDANTRREDGSLAFQNVRLVAVHDHKSRFVGHYCLMQDHTREHQLQSRIRELTEALERSEEIPAR